MYCPICLKSDTEPFYQIPECQHSFHTNCIVAWFRKYKNHCPLCNCQGINRSRRNFCTYNISARLKLFKEITKENKKNKTLINLLNKHTNLQIALRSINRSRRSYIRSKDIRYHPYDVCREVKKFEKKLEKITKDITSCENQIMEFPIIPIIIPHHVNICEKKDT